jgi:hypothetical protein
MRPRALCRSWRVRRGWSRDASPTPDAAACRPRRAARSLRRTPPIQRPVFLTMPLRMLAVKNSRKRMPARSPAAATSVGSREVAERETRSFILASRWLLAARPERALSRDRASQGGRSANPDHSCIPKSPDSVPQATAAPLISTTLRPGATDRGPSPRRREWLQ